jgi:cysteine-rich repeat protein
MSFRARTANYPCRSLASFARPHRRRGDGLRYRSTGVLFLTACLFFSGPSAAAACTGDCNDDGRVSVDELVKGVNISLGMLGVDSCPSFDRDGNHTVSIDELITAVNATLEGCPHPSPTSTPNAIPTATVVPTSTATEEAPTPTATESLTSTVTLTPTYTPTPTFTPTPIITQTPSEAVCGNGVVETGETCDDGNTEDGDRCPSDCVILTCATDGSKQDISVTYAAPGGTSVASVTVLLIYPDGTVQIPGTGGSSSVGGRVTNRPSGFLFAINDLDYALRAAIAGTKPFSASELFRVSFDHCKDSPPATNSDFSCNVVSAANTSGQTVSGVTCATGLL